MCIPHLSSVKPPGLFRLFGLLLGFSVALYAWLARYAHPVADDFCYAAKSRGMGLWDWSRTEWLYWNGRYASNLLMVHGPLSWSADFLPGYRAVPLILLCLTFLGLWFLLRRIAGPALGIRKQWMAALLILLLYLNLMPDLGEGFYWYTGASTYQLGSILLLFHMGLLWGKPYTGPAGAVVGLLNLLLAFATTGMDEIHMLLMLGLHLVHLGWCIRSGKGVASACLLLTVVGAGAVLMASAPGNAVRAGLFAGTHRLGWSLGMSGLQALRFVGQWAISPAFLATGLLYVPLHRHLRDTIPTYARALRLPAWAVLPLPFLLVMATTFPAYWSTGLLGQHRTVNVACLLCLPVFFLALGIAVERGPLRRWAGMSWNSRHMQAALVLLLLAFHLTGNGLAVQADLWNGRAAEYHRVLQGREETMRAAANDPRSRLLLEPLARPPRSLTSYEEHGPLRDWMLHCEARYFGVAESQVEMRRPMDRTVE
jgi:hypothetical protein